MLERLADIARNIVSSAASLLKVVLLSRRPFPAAPVNKDRVLVVLANGPSLNNTLEHDRSFVMSHDRLAVNFAANATVFFALRPQLYVLADPHFFHAADSDPNVAALWGHLNRVDWSMTLFVPVKFAHLLFGLIHNKNINPQYFNLTPAEGFGWIRRMLYSAGLAMPRPRNVLIASLMVAIRRGYGTIYVAGADHTWTRTLSVDNENHVVSVQPHFYKESDGEQTRVNTEYMHYPLHQILHSLYIAFRSYHLIEDYARHRGVDIYNITPDSMIDAFRRKNDYL